MLTTHPLLVPRLRKSRSYTSSDTNVPLWSVTGPLYLHLLLYDVTTQKNNIHNFSAVKNWNPINE
jgi:hypothetical protein